MYKLNENTSGTKRETDTSVERQKTRKRERERENRPGGNLVENKAENPAR